MAKDYFKSKAKRGKTVTAETRGGISQNQQEDDMEYNSDDGGVLANIHHANVGISSGLSNAINSMQSPQPIRVREKKHPNARRKKKNNDAEGPLALAQKLQSQYEPKHPGAPKRARQASHSQHDFRIPRKQGYAERRPAASSLTTDGKNSASRRPQARRHNNVHSHHDRPSRPSTSTGTRPSGSDRYFSQVTTGMRHQASSHKKKPHEAEVLDLCSDDDDGGNEHDGGNDTTITEHSEDDRSPRSTTSRASSSTVRSKSSSSGRSGQSPRTVESLSGSSTMSTPAAAAASTALSTNEFDQDSSDESVGPAQSTKKSTTRYRAPDDNGLVAPIGTNTNTSDLLPSYDEPEEEEEPQDICQSLLDDIKSEPFGGTPSSSRDRKSPPKRLRSSSATKAGKKKSTPSTDVPEWGSLPRSTPSLNFTKVNTGRPGKKQKKKGNAISKPGSSIQAFSSLRSPKVNDPIEDFESSDDEYTSNTRRRAATRTGGVQKNPYAARRTSRDRKAKNKATQRMVELDGSSDEEDDTALAQVSVQEQHPVRKLVDVVRIAIGKKVISSNCKLQYRRDSKQGKIVLIFEDGKGKTVRHTISLDDNSVQEMKYFMAGDDADDTEPISIDFDESEQVTFLAMQVTPNEKNGLSKYTNSYTPPPPGRGSDTPANKRYIAIEFRSDKDFKDLLKPLKKDSTLGAFLDGSCKLKSAEVEDYGQSLFQANVKERTDRESSLGSPRIRRTRKKKQGSKVSNEVMLVFPFGADEDMIDKAANGLQEAGDVDTVVISAVSSAGDVAALKTSDEDEEEATSPSEENAISAEDDDKDDPAGKAKSRAHFLTIRDEDYDRLQPGEFLNDTLIDFWFQWIWRKQRHSDSDVHFFTSHFYTALAKGGPKAVTSWTAKKNIDIFTKSFIFIPINQSLHWSLCVVVNPGSILNEAGDREATDDELFPCLFFFDSLKAHRKNQIAKNVRAWLNSEWQRLEKAKAENAEEAVSPFDKKTMRVYDPRVPYQDNSWDCGVFVCRYGYAIYRLRGRRVTYADRDDRFQSLITDNHEFDFDREDIVRIRGELAQLVDNLSSLYKEWKKLEEEAEKKAEEESKKPAARQLMLENGDASASTGAVEATPDEEQDEISARAMVEQLSATTEQAEARRPTSPRLEKPPQEVESSDGGTNDVEMTDADGTALVADTDEAVAEVEMADTNESEDKNESTSLSLQSTGMHVDAEVGNIQMPAAEQMEDETSEETKISPVKLEEDMFGDVGHPQTEEDENMEAQCESAVQQGNEHAGGDSGGYEVYDI